ncbi:MAG: hypothetical protein JWM43_700 [Acidobacteriaceae bacterium]|nr:hypothetical protein [Acidobacteriaceae bacterium]
MKRLLPLLLLSTTVLSTTAFAAPPAVSGAWTITGDVQGYPINETCNFTQDAKDKDKLTGTCKNAEGKTFDTTVTIVDQKVTFVHAGEYEGQPLTLTYIGSYSEKGELSGVINVAPLGYDGTFTAKKTEAK